MKLKLPSCSTAWALVMVMACALSGCAHKLQSPTVSELRDCFLTDPLTATRLSARCGSYNVPEDRGRSDSVSITQQLALVPGRAMERGDAPVFYLAGGPGSAATMSGVPLFTALRSDVDVVLMDQRGTGPLTRFGCSVSTRSDHIGFWGLDEVRNNTKECADKLAVDPQLYGTDAFVEDIEAVRKALGYEQIQLLGVSYGTRPALAYASRYPNRVRRMVLDALWSPRASAYDLDRTLRSQLERMSAACRANPDCPSDAGVESRLSSLAQRVSPPKILYRRNKFGDRVRVRVDGVGIAQTLQAALSSGVNEKRLAKTLERLDSEEGVDEVASFLLEREDSFVLRHFNWGLYLSVLCSEEPPPDTKDEGIGVSLQPRAMAQASCGAWPVEPRPKLELQAADVPTLVISGDSDPLTPPNLAETFARELPRARHVVVKGGHGNVTGRCQRTAVNAFFKGASLEALKIGC